MFILIFLYAVQSPTEFSTLSLHDALPISVRSSSTTGSSTASSAAGCRWSGGTRAARPDTRTRTPSTFAISLVRMEKIGRASGRERVERTGGGGVLEEKRREVCRWRNEHAK